MSWHLNETETFGTCTGEDGSIYHGGVKDMKKHGKGKLTYPDGAVYDGEWKDDNMHGHGIYTWPEGDKYDGEWKDDNMHGHGIYTWPNGSRYDGTWANDNRNGHGIMTYSKEQKEEIKRIRFEGVFKNGEPHEGILTKRMPNYEHIHFSIPGHVPLQDNTRINALQDKVNVLAEMIDEIQSGSSEPPKKKK
jgi:hypothetical protein